MSHIKDDIERIHIKIHQSDVREKTLIQKMFYAKRQRRIYASSHKTQGHLVLLTIHKINEVFLQK